MSDFNRRDFLKVTGGITAGLGAGLLASASPFRALQLAVEWSQDQYVPEKGDESVMNTVCNFCESRCAVRLRCIGGRPVKADIGTRGCARAQLIIQHIHHPDLIRQPLKRKGKRGSGVFEPVSWNELIGAAGSRLKELLAAGKLPQIASISHGRLSDGSLLLESVLFSAGIRRLYREASIETLSAAPFFSLTAKRGSVRCDLDAADTVLSIGYDLFGGGFSAPDAANRLFERLAAGKARYLHIGPVKNRSASCATEFAVARPGTEEIAALGILRAAMEKSGRTLSNKSELSSFCRTVLTNDEIESLTGIQGRTLDRIASLLMSSSAPLCIAGRGGFDIESSQTLSGTAIIINALSGASGRTVFAAESPAYEFSGIDRLAAEEQPSFIFVYESNPVHRSVFGAETAKALSRAQTVVSFSSFIDDTSRFADFIVPAGLPVPASDAQRLSPSGSGIKDPCDALRSIFAAAEISIGSAEQKKGSVSAVYSAASGIASFTRDLERIRTLRSTNSRLPLAMIPAELPSVGDGSLLSYPYENKNHPEFLIEKEELSVWMNPETAERHRLSNGESIALKSERGMIEGLRVRLSNLYPPDCVAVPVGFGHTGLTRYADGRGVNMKRIASASADPSGFALWHTTPVKIV